MNIVYIAGNMGAGKTTLLNSIKNKFPECVNEEIEDNPYLKLYFNDPSKYAFHLQIYYLLTRKKRIVTAMKKAETIIVDRGLEEDVKVYSRYLYENGVISYNDFGLIESLYSEIQIPPVKNTIYIYLYASVETLYYRIKQRGYEHDKDITMDYIGSIDSYYRRWVSQLPQTQVVYIDMETTDFITDNNAVNKLYKKIEVMLNG